MTGWPYQLIIPRPHLTRLLPRTMTMTAAKTIPLYIATFNAFFFINLKLMYVIKNMIKITDIS